MRPSSRTLGRRAGDTWLRVAGVSLAVLASVAMGTARAQAPEPQPPVNQQPPDVDLGPVARPVTLYLLDRSQVTVTFRGDHGIVRVTGVLDSAPTAPLQLTEPGSGRTREANWSEVRLLSEQQFPAEGFPLGSYAVNLVSDPVPATGLGTGTATATATTGYYSRALDTGRGSWRAAALPQGDLTLSGAPFGTLKVAVSRLISMQMDPVRASVTDLPRGTIRMEILNGVTIGLPLKDVQFFQRDVRSGTAVVTLADDQSFTGRLVELPKVSIPLTDRDTMRMTSIPLERIAILERIPPAGRRF